MASTSKDPQARSWSPPEPLIVSPLMNFYPTYDPLLPPPTTSALPTLPSGFRSQSSLPAALSSTHVLSTHIVTAAYPRCPGPLFSPAKHEPPANEGKAERKARVEREFQEMQTLKRAAERRERGLEERNEVLYNVFNRYKRKGEWLQDGLTLVVTHAVGFPKEVSLSYSSGVLNSALATQVCHRTDLSLPHGFSGLGTYVRADRGTD